MSSTSNRLIDETSPYLLQHAHNPVDWYPWGEEALTAAADQNKPIFLSVGYSACHWCHVMEHESFESEEIAALMNEHFINIKVDREERPDIDQIYMQAVQLMTQRGGWPMSVFLTPDGRPFFGGTYWPPESRMGMPGFKDVLTQLHQYWTEKQDDVQESAGALHEALQKMASPQFGDAELNEATLRNAMRSIVGSADRTHGGFGGAPKFPHPMDLRVLLRCWRRFDNDDALSVVKLTLDKMASGGIYDHLGGGFHRYSTDARWLVPHFEKMLYDNALLMPAYIEGYQATGDERYLKVVDEIALYVSNEMTSPAGAFFSTQDADTEGEEGKFFVWSEEEIDGLLTEDEARVFKYVYDVTPDGNWEGTNILNRPKSHQQAAQVLGIDGDELTSILEKARTTLKKTRDERVRPGTDEKILSGWNGLMISALALAETVNILEAAACASSAATFVLDNMLDKQGRLLHSYKDGQARFLGYLDDYAAMINGLVDLFQVNMEVRWLDSAVTLAETMIEQFGDESGPAFFYTSKDQEELITRNKDSQDNATPSGNALAATALLRLGRLCGRLDLEEQGMRTLEFLGGLLSEHPRASGQALLALDFAVGPAHEIVMVTDRSDVTIDAADAVYQRFVPNKFVLVDPLHWINDAESSSVADLVAGKTAVDGKLTTYICERGTCQSPIVGLDDLRTAMEELAKRTE